MSLREKIKLSGSSVGAPVPTASFYSEIDPAAKLRIGLNCKLSMSAGNASLGHACVSPARVEDHSTPDGADECSIAIAQNRKGKFGR